jgi:hypothetical protein
MNSQVLISVDLEFHTHTVYSNFELGVFSPNVGIGKIFVFRYVLFISINGRFVLLLTKKLAWGNICTRLMQTHTVKFGNNLLKICKKS